MCIVQGCYNKFRYFINQHLHLLVGAMVGLGAAQMLAIGFAFCISKVGSNCYVRRPMNKMMCVCRWVMLLLKKSL